VSFLAQQLTSTEDFSREEARHGILLLLRTAKEERNKVELYRLLAEIEGWRKSPPRKAPPLEAVSDLSGFRE
jgi:hypothetical protein